MGNFKENQEGLVDVVDESGRKFNRALSKVSIEVMDLLSQGPIDGLVNGKYEYEGELYDIGYKKATFIPYENPPGLGINWLRSVYWNDVPVVSSDNKFNFSNISVSFTEGTPNGAVLNQINPYTTTSRTIGEKLIATRVNDKGEPDLNGDNIKSYRILNKECRGIYVNIRIQTLQKTEYGEEETRLMDAEVKYRVYYKPIYSNSDNNGSFTLGKEITILGKVQYGMVKSDKISFFGIDDKNIENFLGWEIKILRLTPDSLTSMVQNVIYIDSITEIYENIYTYPYSAITRSRFSSEYFAQIPTRAFHTKLLKVKIPSNYDPITRRYDETIPWDGSFKTEKVWTNNPAWCLYDLITNKNHGLGKYIDPNLMDKWTLYEIAKYCDTLVPDGYGGLEPRFTANIILNNRAEAFKVINDFASIFRGLIYFGRGLIYAIQDSPKTPLLTFTNANIKDGNFNYSSSSRRVRHTVAIVRYNDERNFYKPAIEYVEDVDGITKYGIREIEIDAVGCTSKGQAIRFGRWALLTETLETETINFTAGIGEASYLKPGDVFNVIDNYKKLNRYAGRINTFIYDGKKTYITLDDELTLTNGDEYSIELVTPSYNYNPAIVENLTSENISDIRKSFIQSGRFVASASTITTNSDNKSTIILDGLVFDENNYSVVPNTIWSLFKINNNQSYEYLANFKDPYNDLYRVINIEEKENNEYNIVGLQYNIQKYLEIESGLNFERYNLDILPPSEPEYTYALSYYTSVATQKAALSWTMQSDYLNNNTHTAIFINNPNESALLTGNRPDKKQLHTLLNPDTTYYEFEPKETGYYTYSLWGYDARLNQFSINGITGGFSITRLNPIENIVIGGLTLVTGAVPTYDQIKGVTRDTQRFYEPSPIFGWQIGSTGEGFNINYNYRLTIREPSYSNTPSNNIYYQYIGKSVLGQELRHQFPFEHNISASGGPFRSYDVVVEAIDENNNTSAGNYIDLITGYNEVWSNPYGYDILYLENQRITGLYLSNLPDKITGNYISRQLIDPSLNINIYYISGVLPTDIAGGYIYFSTGLFSGENITGYNRVSSNYNIFTGHASYDKNTQAFYCPLPYENRYMKPTGYIALTAYDSFDAELIKYNSYLRTGLPLSNIVQINFSGITNQFTIADTLNFFNHTDKDNNWNIKTTFINGRRVIINSYRDQPTGAIIRSQT